MVNPQRRDYAKNLRSKIHAGCVWCGSVDIRPGPVTTATYCSDECIQADMDGIDDHPPAFMLAYNISQGGEAYVSRKIAEYNDAYGGAKNGHER